MRDINSIVTLSMHEWWVTGTFHLQIIGINVARLLFLFSPIYVNNIVKHLYNAHTLCKAKYAMKLLSLHNLLCYYVYTKCSCSVSSLVNQISFNAKKSRSNYGILLSIRLGNSMQRAQAWRRALSKWPHNSREILEARNLPIQYYVHIYYITSKHHVSILHLYNNITSREAVPRTGSLLF